MFDRHYKGMDEAKPVAVEKRHGRGHRTARENLSRLVDDGTFVEYGPLMVAAQRRRRSLDDLIDNTQGDGMVAGIGSVNGDLFGDDDAQTMVMSYDYMVLAGTQGLQNHRKKDRLFELAEQNQLPTVLLAEGGGGRPGDTEHEDNFVDCIRSREKPAADAEIGQQSAMLCHLANISYRVGNQKLDLDPKTETFPNCDEANSYLKRNYRKPWVVPETV